MIDREGQMKLDDIDFNIERLEKELHRLNEARRELVNYYGLNNHDSTGKASMMSHKA